MYQTADTYYLLVAPVVEPIVITQAQAVGLNGCRVIEGAQQLQNGRKHLRCAVSVIKLDKLNIVEIARNEER